MSGLRKITGKTETPPEKKPKVKKEDRAPVLGKYINDIFDEKLTYTMQYRGGSFFAGDLGVGARILCLKYLGAITSSVDLQGVRYMTNGTFGHDRWDKWLKKSDLLISSEGRLSYPELQINGRYDFLISHPDVRRLLLELKTIGSYRAKDMVTPKPEHIAQWAFYSDRLQVPNGFIIYEERDSLKPRYLPMELFNDILTLYDIFGRPVEKLEGYMSGIYDKIRFVLWCVNSDSFPAEACPECTKGCQQKDLCAKFSSEKKLVSYEEWREFTS